MHAWSLRCPCLSPGWSEYSSGEIRRMKGRRLSTSLRLESTDVHVRCAAHRPASHHADARHGYRLLRMSVNGVMLADERRTLSRRFRDCTPEWHDGDQSCPSVRNNYREAVKKTRGREAHSAKGITMGL